MKKLIFAIVVLINISTAQPPQFAPPTISFQGILKDTTGNLIADGTYNMTFEIWRLFQGNQEMLWQEIKDVQVVDGLVTTVLGDVAPIIGFPPQGEKVLRIQLGGVVKYWDSIHLHLYRLLYIRIQQVFHSVRVSQQFQTQVDIPCRSQGQ